jgi:predicted deacylase
MPDGKIITIPMGVVEGAQPGPALGVVAAVHGCEFCGVEALIRLYEELDPARVTGTLRMVMVANMPAFVAKTMYRCPVDGGNIGRSFPGSASESYSAMIGHTIWQEVVEASDVVLDLHGGDLIEVLTRYIGYHTTGNEELDSRARALAEAFDSPNIEVRPVTGSKEGIPLPEAASLHGKLGLLVEAGSQGRRDEIDVAFHHRGILNVMKHLGMLEGAPTREEKEVRTVDTFIAVQSSTSGIFYPEVEADEIVDKGQLIARIKSFTGQVVEEVVAPERSVVLGVITPPAAYEGSMLFGLARLLEVRKL